ncbi:hypothetical protein DFH06DRAFT_1386643 [Mycena polygramma]|nr:hypothetical protein DFH06DRAFT_1386643 [Mycena polygramma]
MNGHQNHTVWYPIGYQHPTSHPQVPPQSPYPANHAQWAPSSHGYPSPAMHGGQPQPLAQQRPSGFLSNSPNHSLQPTSTARHHGRSPHDPIPAMYLVGTDIVTRSHREFDLSSFLDHVIKAQRGESSTLNLGSGPTVECKFEQAQHKEAAAIIRFGVKGLEARIEGYHSLTFHGRRERHEPIVQLYRSTIASILMGDTMERQVLQICKPADTTVDREKADEKQAWIIESEKKWDIHTVEGLDPQQKQLFILGLALLRLLAGSQSPMIRNAILQSRRDHEEEAYYEGVSLWSDFTANSRTGHMGRVPMMSPKSRWTT